MGRRQRRRRGETGGGEAATSTYAYGEDDSLTLRDELSAGTLRTLEKLDAQPAASAEDRWQRRMELLFERLVVSWEIAGLPLDDQRSCSAATGWRRPTSAGRCARRSPSTCARAIRTWTSDGLADPHPALAGRRTRPRPGCGGTTWKIVTRKVTFGNALAACTCGGCRTAPCRCRSSPSRLKSRFRTFLVPQGCLSLPSLMFLPLPRGARARRGCLPSVNPRARDPAPARGLAVLRPHGHVEARWRAG